MTEFREQQVVMDDGATLHLRIHDGSGVPVVFLHDIDVDGRYWDPVVVRLLELEPDLAVFVLDMRGHGLSTIAEPPSRKRLVQDVKRVCRALGIEEPMLCGHGWGADVALAAPAAGVVAVNPRLGRADAVPIDGDLSAPQGMGGAVSSAVSEACRQGLSSAKPLRRSRRDAPLMLVYADPADAAALEGTDVLEQAAEMFAIQQGTRHLPVEMPSAIAALVLAWMEETT